MRFRLPSHLVLALSGLVLLGGCSSAPLTAPPAASGDPVVATFAGETLTLGAFEDRYTLALGSREAAAADSLEAYEDFLSRYVDFRLKVRQARDLGLADDPEIRREINEYREQLAKPYLLERTVLEDIVRDLYEKQREEVRASHILLRVDEDAAPEDTLRAYERPHGHPRLRPRRGRTSPRWPRAIPRTPPPPRTAATSGTSPAAG
jgi:peptidyl-prolyl cis-trans isomerase SurA